ncbi:MAG: adenylate kinase [Solirubrobacterales bacterium]|nr:adenylate kinase [Solirubrobacterales bacterium]MCB8916024.1 adenylate kinase [Thermoleophilales bacterium]
MAELNLILLGPPGSGKGTQGERLQEDLEYPYYATGDILRAAVKEGTEVGKSAQEYMDRGDLVPDEVIIGIISERLESGEADHGFILDGFPRTVVQAEALDAELEKLGRQLTAVILIDVDDEEIVNRLSGRRVCQDKGHVYHVDHNPPEQEGICDVDGSELYIRDDDKPEVVRHRLEQYQEKTAPLVDYYKKQGLLNKVEGADDPDRVSEKIRTLVSTLSLEEGS